MNLNLRHDDLPGWPGSEPVALARQAAEAIRAFCHAARPASRLGEPSAAYDVLSALSAAAARTGQAIVQISRYLDGAAETGQLGHDLGDDPAISVEAAAIFLTDAQLSAAALAGDLDAACQQLALLHHQAPAPGERS